MRALIRRLEVLEKRMGEAAEDQLWALRRTHYKQFQPVFVAALDGEITWDVLHEWCQTNPGPDHGREQTPSQIERARRRRKAIEAKLDETRWRMERWCPELLEGAS